MKGLRKSGSETLKFMVIKDVRGQNRKQNIDGRDAIMMNKVY